MIAIPALVLRNGYCRLPLGAPDLRYAVSAARFCAQLGFGRVRFVDGDADGIGYSNRAAVIDAARDQVVGVEFAVNELSTDLVESLTEEGVSQVVAAEHEMDEMTR